MEHKLPAASSLLVIIAVASYVIGSLFVRLRAQGKRRRSAAWPMVGGAVQAGHIEPFRTGYLGEGINFRLTVQFSYVADEQTYSGEFLRDFRTEEEALSLLRSLEKGPVYVRHDPSCPSTYVLDPYRDVWQESKTS